MKAGMVALAAFGLLVGIAAAGEKKEGIAAKAAFEKLKTMAGDWDAKADGGHADGGKVNYKVTAGGSVVMETVFSGTGHEMVSMYHLDGDNLVMTHYCAAQNQPRMKLDKAASKPDSLIFVFDGGTNFDPAKDMHIHSAQLTFKDGGKVLSAWDAYKDGKKLGTTTVTLSKP